MVMVLMLMLLKRNKDWNIFFMLKPKISLNQKSFTLSFQVIMIGAMFLFLITILIMVEVTSNQTMDLSIKDEFDIFIRRFNKIYNSKAEEKYII